MSRGDLLEIVDNLVIDNRIYKLLDKNSASPTLICVNPRNKTVYKIWFESPNTRQLDYEEKVYRTKIRPLVSTYGARCPILPYVGEWRGQIKDFLPLLGAVGDHKYQLLLALYILHDNPYADQKYSKLTTYTDFFNFKPYITLQNVNDFSSRTIRSFTTILVDGSTTVGQLSEAGLPTASLCYLISQVILGIFLIYNKGLQHNDLHAYNALVTDGNTRVQLFDWDWSYIRGDPNPVLNADPCNKPCSKGASCNIFFQNGYSIDLFRFLGYIFGIRPDYKSLLLNLFKIADFGGTVHRQIYDNLTRYPRFYNDRTRCNDVTDKDSPVAVFLFRQFGSIDSVFATMNYDVSRLLQGAGIVVPQGYQHVAEFRDLIRQPPSAETVEQQRRGLEEQRRALERGIGMAQAYIRDSESKITKLGERYTFLNQTLGEVLREGKEKEDTLAGLAEAKKKIQEQYDVALKIAITKDQEEKAFEMKSREDLKKQVSRLHEYKQGLLQRLESAKKDLDTIQKELEKISRQVVGATQHLEKERKMTESAMEVEDGEALLELQQRNKLVQDITKNVTTLLQSKDVAEKSLIEKREAYTRFSKEVELQLNKAMELMKGFYTSLSAEVQKYRKEKEKYSGISEEIKTRLEQATKSLSVAEEGVNAVKSQYIARQNEMKWILEEVKRTEERRRDTILRIEQLKKNKKDFETLFRLREDVYLRKNALQSLLQQMDFNRELDRILVRYRDPRMAIPRPGIHDLIGHPEEYKILLEANAVLRRGFGFGTKAMPPSGIGHPSKTSGIGHPSKTSEIVYPSKMKNKTEIKATMTQKMTEYSNASQDSMLRELDRLKSIPPDKATYADLFLLRYITNCLEYGSPVPVTPVKIEDRTASILLRPSYEVMYEGKK